MAIGYSDSIRSQVVQTCTPELLHRAMKSSKVKMVCAQLVDALESKLRGEVCNDDYEEMKKKLKSQLPILTPHATFRNGRRKNDEAIPSGLSIYDIDHIPNPRGYWEEKKKVLAGKLLGGTKFSGGVLAEAGSESGGTKVSGDLQSPASCGQARNVLSVLDLIVLVHVTPSTQGLRLVFVIPEGMDIAMAQRWMSQQLEDSEYDTVVKDLARPSFLVPEEYLLYINEEELFKERKITSTSSALPGGGASLLAGDCKSPGRLADSNPGRFAGASLLAGDCKSPERLTDSNPGCLTGEYPGCLAVENANHKVQSSNLNVQSKESSNLKVQSKENDYVQDNRFPGTNGDNAVSSGTAVQPAQPGDSHGADAPHIGDSGGNQDAGGLGAREKNLIAFDLFTQAAGLGGMEIDTVGSRHSSLLAIMSAGASRVMEEEELMKVVRVKMPSYYQENDCHQLIHDFYAKYADNTKPMSKEVMRVNALAEQKASQQVNSLQLKVNRADGNHTVQSSNLKVQSTEQDYPDPPEMPKKLPKLVELLISRTPEIYKPAVAHAIFPPLATHLWKTRFRYIDNVEHEARLMTLLLAGTGAGKSSVNRPIDFIMEDIRLRDAENLKREKAWKDEMLRKGANKDKRKRPENLIIQEIDADMTNPAFVMRTAEAQEHFLYTSLNELDQFDALKGSGSQQFRIMCLAADPGNKYGQTRVGTMSVTERVTIRFNWNASTTIQKGQRYFSKVLTDGPISRINFCTIPEREIGEDMPVYGTYDDAYREALRPYIENLNKVTGLIECKEAFQLALKLKDENAEFARLSQDRTFENLSFRANVIAYLKACVLYVANGCKWEPEIDEFIRWSEQYDLYCKMRFFGDMIAKENFMAEKSSKRGPQNLLQILPDSFTAAQLLAIRLEHGLDAKGTDMMIRQWLHRNYIRRAYQYTGKRDSCDSCDSFEKLKYRHDGMVIES